MRQFILTNLEQTQSCDKVLSPSGLDTTELKTKALFLVVVWDWQTDISLGKQQKSCCPSLEKEGGCCVLGLEEIQRLIPIEASLQCLRSSGFWKNSSDSSLSCFHSLWFSARLGPEQVLVMVDRVL